MGHFPWTKCLRAVSMLTIAILALLLLAGVFDAQAGGGVDGRDTVALNLPGAQGSPPDVIGSAELGGLRPILECASPLPGGNTFLAQFGYENDLPEKIF